MGKIIVLDAGHGYDTAGKRCLKSLDPDETREWYLNDRIMDMVEELLRDYECTVFRVDDTTGREDISLSARVKAANEAGADVYLSMHHNAGLNGSKGGGTVIFHDSNDAQRNAQAKRLYQHIVSRTGLIGNRSQNVLKKGFYVLKHTNMPAFLVENGFMDSPEDVPIILSKEHAIKTAEGVLAFLVEEFALTKKSANSQPAIPGKEYYPAYRGTKTTLSIALQTLGIDYSYAFRKELAAKNQITGYRGTAAQNTRMYNLLKAGLLKKV